MDRKCPAITQKGGQCTGNVKPGNYYCYWHDPANSDKRHRVAVKAGKSKKGRLAKDLHALLEDLTEQVVSGELEPYPASVAGQLIGVRLRLMEQERKIRETEELESRIEELEEAASGRSQRWGGRHGT